ncbi:hypothetical protein EW026_g2862 [Hermanssonia centrifuga]|nr:hypothetical protein EW026_g7919 [Hermanssonia centrifuga]THG99480.1 hypothetical protein EW026_g2862 [Hermanssonia centrifuga]
MHVLRSTYLPAYSGFIRPPYTTDPFPLNSPTFTPDQMVSPVQSLQRETRVLDLFVALKVREDVWMDESELHLERDESFRDLFDLMQPRSRMEDLVRAYGVREGVIALANMASSSTNGIVSGNANVVSKVPAGSSSNDGRTSSRSKAMSKAPALVPFGALSVSFSSRRVGLVLTTKERKRTIVETERAKDERLEIAAKKLVKELKGWVAARGAG